MRWGLTAARATSNAFAACSPEPSSEKPALSGVPTPRERTSRPGREGRVPSEIADSSTEIYRQVQRPRRSRHRQSHRTARLYLGLSAYRAAAETIVADGFGKRGDGASTAAVESQIRELLALLVDSTSTKYFDIGVARGRAKLDGQLRHVTMYLFRASRAHGFEDRYIAFFIREGRKER